MTQTMRLAALIAKVMVSEHLNPEKKYMPELRRYCDLQASRARSEHTSLYDISVVDAARELIRVVHEKLKISYALSNQKAEWVGISILRWLQLIQSYYDCKYGNSQRYEFDHLLAEIEAKFDFIECRTSNCD